MNLATPGLPPGLRLLRGYTGRHLPADLLAGLLVAALAVPQALGYAVVADVPVQVGLYTLPPALLAYAIFGTSRLLFVGPISTVSVLSGSIVRGLSGGDAELAVELTAVLAITAGAVLVAVGLLRLGWVAQFLSEPIVTGFVAGLVVLVIVGEIPALAGLPAPVGGLFERLLALVRGIPDFHGLTLVLGLTSLAILFTGSRLAPRVPWSLLVLVGGILASSSFDLAGRGVRVVGSVPTGMAIPSIPIADVSLWSGIITGGLAIAAVGIAEGLAAVRTFAPSGGVDPDTDNQEFVAHGAADLASGLFGGMGVGGSLSKTAANARAGAYTQVSGIAAAVVVLLFVVFAAGLLADLPRTVLAAIVINAVWGLVTISDFRRYAAVRRNDGLAAVVAFVGVLALGPLNGLLLAVGQSLLGLIYRSMQVEIDEMGRVDGEKAAWGSVANDSPRRVRAHPLMILASLAGSTKLFCSAKSASVSAQVRARCGVSDHDREEADVKQGDRLAVGMPEFAAKADRLMGHVSGTAWPSPPATRRRRRCHARRFQDRAPRRPPDDRDAGRSRTAPGHARRHPASPPLARAGRRWSSGHDGPVIASRRSQRARPCRPAGRRAPTRREALRPGT